MRPKDPSRSLPRLAILRESAVAVATKSMGGSPLIRNGLYGWTGLGATTLVVLALTPTIARHLGYERFGIWALATSAIGLAGFAEIGIGTAGARLIAQRYADHDWKALSEVATVTVAAALGAGGLIACGLYTESGVIADVLVRSMHASSHQQMVTVIRLASIGLAGTLFRSGALSVSMALQRYDIVAGVSTLQTCLVWVAAALISQRNSDPQLITLSSVIAVWLCALLALAAALRLLKATGFRIAMSVSGTRLVLSYAALTSVSGAGSQLFSSFDRVVVGVLLGGSPLAYYAILTSVAARLNQLSGLLWQGLLPMSSVLAHKRNDIELWRYFVRASVAAAIVNAGIAVILLLVGARLLTVWLGASFAQTAFWPFCILVVTYAAFSVNAPSYHIANGIGAARVCAIAGSVGGFLTITLIALLAPRYGLAGAAAGNLGYLVTLLIIAEVYRRLRTGKLGHERIHPPAV